ncbi:uncharacterized protein TNCV_2156981 [Trichonephila clavipes]|nr:uncharacterized protein TNCV_2156981 [Trichonephila clavipes]
MIRYIDHWATAAPPDLRKEIHEQQKDYITKGTHQEIHQTTGCHNLCEYGSLRGHRLSKAHFWLNGYINKQNCRIWSEANPQVYVETLLHPEKLTVWCALWAGGIIGPYFFKNDEGQIGLHPSQPWQSYARNHI